MALMPKRVKYRKEQRRIRDRKATKGNYVAYGDYGLQALEGAWISGQVLDAGRIASQHYMKREGKLFIRVFPDKPISKKPLETRMGTGKAEVDYWAARVKPGTMLFEIAGVPEPTAKLALLPCAAASSAGASACDRFQPPARPAEPDQDGVRPMTGEEVRKMKDDELKQELAKVRNDLFDLRSQTVTEKVEDTSRFAKLRKDIARMLGEQRRRQPVAK
jgi:large subunit ribosomal protein L16